MDIVTVFGVFLLTLTSFIALLSVTRRDQCQIWPLILSEFKQINLLQSSKYYKFSDGFGTE